MTYLTLKFAKTTVDNEEKTNGLFKVNIENQREVVIRK